MTDRLPIDLAGLATAAPDGLFPRVVVGSGIADGFVVRDSALGEVVVAFGPHGVTSLDLADDPDRFAAGYQHRFGRPLLAVDRAPESIARHLDRAIAAGRPGRLPVDLERLTPFQAAVLRTTATIPRGEVRPYAWVARQIGRPGAVRAVGTALATNPVPLIIPCHRVVRADGTFGDYSLGDPDNKPRLLALEGIDVTGLAGLAARGVRFVGSDTTGIFCHPTCRHARRIGASHRVEFSSPEEAAIAGFRPCSVCRPAP